MDKLRKDLGGPPYDLQSLINFAAGACALWEQLASGASFDHDYIVRKIECLEIVCTILSRDRRPSEGVPGFDPLNNKWPVHLDMPKVIMDMKDRIFKSNYLGSKEDRCHYCCWAFDRVAPGIKESWVDQTGRDTAHPVNGCCFLWVQDTWPDLPVLQQRLSRGCRFCGFLRECAKDSLVSQEASHGYTAPPLGSTVSLWIQFDWVHGWPTAEVGESSKGHSKPHSGHMSFASLWIGIPKFFPLLYRREIMKFRMESPDPFVRSELHAANPPFDEPLSTEAVKIMRQHLQLSNHTTKDIKASFIPKRLLKIFYHDNLLTAKLINTESHKAVNPGSLAYAALSYCWGTRKQAQHQSRLLAHTKARLYCQITKQDVSPVISNAFTVCRSLGIHYLWVDALCIQQDDTADWDEQSGKMGDVYDSALVTICIVSSDSCLEYFLKRRTSYPPCAYRSTLSPERLREFILRPIPLRIQIDDSNMIWTHHPLVHDLGVSRWIKRGWTFQEKAYGNRKLYFGKSMWHCQRDNLIVSEIMAPRDVKNSDPIPGVNLRDVLQPRDLLSALTVRHALNDQAAPIHESYEMWQQLTSKFSALDWTNETDLLPGLSGLASTFHRAVDGDSYIAGHWQGDLACSLIWKSSHSPSRTSGAKTTLDSFLRTCGTNRNPRSVPSWSWGSGATGQIEPSIYRLINTLCRVRTHLRPEFTFSEAPRIVTRGADSYGRVVTASLRLAGRAISIGELKWFSDGAGYQSYVASFPPHAEACMGAALVLTDWSAPPVPKSSSSSSSQRPQTPTAILHEWNGMEEEQRSRARLLLISSCCSDWPFRVSEYPDLKGAKRSPLFDRDLFLGQLYRPDYRQTYMQDVKDPGGASEKCPLCQRPQPRDAWGLLIFPADIPGNYFRIGIFISRAAHGGSALFHKASDEEIELL